MKWIALGTFRIAAACCLSLGWAQPTVAPSTEPVGTPRGDDLEGYNIRESFELGYRFASIDGNRGKYRSDVNFRNGVRLLGSRVGIQSKDGKGRLFDEFTLSTQGLGGDPYQFANLRIQRNRLYQYDLLWRENQYFSPAPTIAGGAHFADTQHRLQDHNLLLFPSSRFKLFGGYSRNGQAGTALATQYFAEGRAQSIYPLFANVRREQNEYRLGAEATFAGIKLNVLRTWDFFKDDSTDDATRQSPILGSNGTSTLEGFRRAEPYHGSAPGWRVNLFRDQKGWLALNGRFTHVSGRRNFILDENATRLDLGGTRLGRQVVVFGDARRPVTAANLTVSLFPGEKLTIANHTSYHQTQMDGTATYREFSNQTLDFTEFAAEYLGVRLLSNSTDAQYQFTRGFGIHAGYHFATRRVRSRQSGEEFEQDNRQNAGRFGVRLRPRTWLSFFVDGDIGRNSRPFLPVGSRDYYGYSGRAQIKRKSFLLQAQAKSDFRFNGFSLWSHSARARQFSADAAWDARPWLHFDGGYSELHLGTITGLGYWINFQLIDTDRSYYVSNLHTFYLSARLSLAKKADLTFGYSRVEDTGDGRSTLEGGGAVYSSLNAFRRVQTFPLSYHSPMVRLSVPLNRNVRWNFGYQHYGYAEQFGTVQDYRANTGYTSLLWSF